MIAIVSKYSYCRSLEAKRLLTSGSWSTTGPVDACTSQHDTAKLVVKETFELVMNYSRLTDMAMGLTSIGKIST